MIWQQNSLSSVPWFSTGKEIRHILCSQLWVVHECSWLECGRVELE